ncbi:MAG: FAD-dependent oxidoreductase, partial [Armatimonadetes bacterium]|nr:FAD-dependent oxidoreductase [Armatimonadota bacterium]
AALLLLAAPAATPQPFPALSPPNRPFSAPGRRVLDIERLRVVPAPRFPNDVPTCQALVVGGGLGGVAAAEDLARAGVTVILTEPTGHLGGQLTAQGLSVPDENRFIEQDPGPGTRHYRQLRDQVRLFYGLTHGIVTGSAGNVGRCWVSRVSGEPAVWEQAIRDRLAPLAGPRGIRRILLRHQLLDVQRYPGNGEFSYADFLDLDTRRIVRIGASFLLDATETGDALALAGCPWTLGQEARDAYNEPDAPPEAHPEWVQSFTYDFVVRWTPQGPHPIIPKPVEYDFFRSLGEYTLVYDYLPPRGPVPYKVFGYASGAGGPFWTYRRLIAASSFEGNPAYAQDVSLINWRGNDFREESFLGRTPEEQARILSRGKAFAQGFLYWLQTECPRDGGGVGYPEMQPAGDVLGGDGFAPFPYVRESRRLLGESTLTENDLLPDPAQPDRTTGTPFFDSVGLALYAIDIHPARGEPPLLRPVLPYALPLGAFIARSGPTNVLPAALDIGASRLAAASARTHPTEWMAGEIAGHLAAFCLRHGVMPTQVRHTPELLSAFQAELEADGIPTRWSEVLTSGEEKP